MPQTLLRPEASRRKLHDGTSVFSSGRRPQVLVVEDDPVQALLLNLMLEHLGVDSLLVNDGAAAVDAVKAGRYALVLMDYLMPVLNGVDATRLIRRWERDSGRAATPIVAVTASAMGSECEAYLAAGMNDVILKPFSAQALADVLVRHGLVRHGLAHAPDPLVHGAVS